uniref:Reverse transcriptase n=1 Tax=Oncorhynchus tshawytscha TaxID=74940 RepID=A0A8C8EVU7_ONCTS
LMLQKSSKPEKLGLVLKQQITLKASITFLQETHIGPKDIDLFEIATTWNSYFTVYSTQSKGAAILLNKNIEQHYQYVRHDEGPTGSYIVLFCKLYGQSFTLVNLYNHANDKRVLETLTQYLQEVTGILVVGGDFNTVIDPDIDRICATGNAQYTLLRRFLEEFTSSLNLVDIWGRLNRTKKDFSRSEKKSHSRLDMFFIVLRELLPNVVGSAGSKKQLLQGCPLTPTIITLSLTLLASIVRQHLPDTTVEVFRHRQCLYVNMPADRYSVLRKLLSKFIIRSGLNLVGSVGRP